MKWASLRCGLLWTESVYSFGKGRDGFFGRRRRENPVQPSDCNNCAATATAITSGSLPVMPGTPIGQVMRASSSAVKPRASSRWLKVAHLVLLPMRPM
jgi:hypothetical protein